MVASSIIAIIALALLQTHSNNTKLIRHMDKQYHAKEEFSLILLNGEKNLHGKSITLYDLLRRKFKFSQSDTIKWLKDKKIEYTQKEFSKIDLLETQLSKMALEEAGINKDDMPELKLLIDKVIMDSKDGGAIGFIVNAK